MIVIAYCGNFVKMMGVNVEVIALNHMTIESLTYRIFMLFISHISLIKKRLTYSCLRIVKIFSFYFF